MVREAVIYVEKLIIHGKPVVDAIEHARLRFGFDSNFLFRECERMGIFRAL